MQKHLDPLVYPFCFGCFSPPRVFSIFSSGEESRCSTHDCAHTARSSWRKLQSCMSCTYSHSGAVFMHTPSPVTDQIIYSFFFPLGALVPSAHVHKRVVSAEVCLRSGGLQKPLRIIISASGTIFNLSNLYRYKIQYFQFFFSS